MHDLISFSDQQASPGITIHIEDCRNVLKTKIKCGISYDAIITDPPYELGMHKLAWDQTGIAFSSELWALLHTVLKPGGFVAAFAAPRLYHRMAVAAEDQGFTLYPFLMWQFENGLQKPINVSELFDRDNLTEREIIGYRPGSGFTRANVEQGAQQRTHTRFPVYARHVSPESVEWRGWYYGVNCMKPMMEPIMLAQKAIAADRAIDNIRQHRTGALHLDALAARQKNGWATTILAHPKTRKAKHGSNHCTVKPTSLMQDLCMLLCPPGGHILDPFAGTGSTGIAASQCGFNCDLIECNSEMADVIARRLNSETALFR